MSSCSLGKVSVSCESCSTRCDSLSTMVSSAARACLSVCLSIGGLKHWAGPGSSMVLLGWPPPHFRMENLGILWEAAKPGEPLPWGGSSPPAAAPAHLGAHTGWPQVGGWAPCLW